MSLTQTKPAAAKESNTVGEGDDVATFKVADPKGEWFAAKGEFPLIDTESGTRFEAGVPTRAIKTSWVQRQIDAGGLAAVDAPDDAKGKAATAVNPEVASEKPSTDDTSTTMGNGMQSGVAA